MLFRVISSQNLTKAQSPLKYLVYSGKKTTTSNYKSERIERKITKKIKM